MPSQKETWSKKLFEMAYQWGRIGVITDEKCNAWQTTIDDFLSSQRASQLPKELEKETWEIELREKFDKTLIVMNREVIIDFISQTLSSYRQRVLKMLENLEAKGEDENYDEGFFDAINKAQEAIKKLN